MQVEVVMLPWDSDAGAFDTARLEAIQEERSVEQMDSQLVRVGGAPQLILVLGVKHPPKRPGDALSGHTREVYDGLRDWRNAHAAVLGIPPYRVVTNALLAAVATRAPTSRAELLEVHGVGPRIAELHGDALLSTLERLRGDATAGSKTAPSSLS